MWCNHCGQDVPAIAGPSEGQLSCARCNHSFDPSVDEQDAGGLARAVDAAFAPDSRDDPLANSSTALLEDWQLEEDLRRAERITGGASQPDDDGERVTLRTDQPTGHTFAPRHVRSAQSTHQPEPPSGASSLGMLATCAMLLGVMGMCCGAALLVISFQQDRAGLWNLGMPLALAGQAGLVLGLVLQIYRARRDGRQAADRLNRVDQQLDDLRHTTTLLESTTDASSRSFYQHFAGGASPKLLLADLKGQMDVLAQRVANSER